MAYSEDESDSEQKKSTFVGVNYTKIILLIFISFLFMQNNRFNDDLSMPKISNSPRNRSNGMIKL